MMTSRHSFLAAFFVLACLGSLAPGEEQEPVQFNRDIRGLLFDRCVACHGPDEKHRQADLRLDTEDGAKEWVIVPGDVEGSEFIARITAEDPDMRMPPADSGKSLTKEEIALLKRWIEEGAEWQPHWAFIPPKRPDLPKIHNESWVKNEIDRFVLHRLEEEGLQPSQPATKEKLLRRVSFDLTGLPPTIEELDAFLADDSPDAYEKIVDKMLASPRYGETLATTWLQNARFADSNGYQNDFRREQWPWRDWVIKAFNENMPYDQFVLEQIAGDLLPNPTRDQLVATGFNRNNRTVTEAGSISEEWRVENNVDRVETTSTLFLGLTMGCCRCHDHKYDPITQKEFYEFFSFFDALDEEGVYTEQKGNVPPMISLPTPEDEEKLKNYDQQIASAEQSFKEKSLAAAAAYLASASQITPPSLDVQPVLALPLTGDLSVATGRAEVSYPAGTPVFEEGLIGQSLKLNGSENSHVVVEKGISPERNDTFSYAIWVRPNGRNGAIIGQMEESLSSRGWDTLLLGDGRLKVHILHHWPQNGLDVTTKTTIPNGQWSHVAVTYDGSSKAEGVSIYINGKKSEVDIGSNSLTESIKTDLPVRLGRRSQLYFNGLVSEFSWYDRVLTPSEVENLLQHQLTKAAQETESSWTDARKSQLKDFLVTTDDGDLKQLKEQIETLKKERKEFNDSIPTVMIMKDRETPRPTYVLDRGAYDAPKKDEQLYPGVPSIFKPLPTEYGRNRLALAHWLIDPENPLVARVQVNRVWQRLFGVGIVKSSENFGVQADPPSHPELLDWLAVEFMESGWDLKKLHKLIVMSATYQQSSETTAEMAKADPENRLLARGPRFRLPAESIRDNALAISGLLVEKIGGPSVKPYQPPGLWEELAGGANEGPYIQSHGDDLYRRSLYTNRKRTVPHTTMATFDAPSFEYCTVRRAITNTPLQALALLNDLTYLEAGRKLAERMILEGGNDVDDRLTLGFRLATSRMPTSEELEVLRNAVKHYHEIYSQDQEAAEQAVSHGESPRNEAIPVEELAAYTTIAEIILNLDESITKS